MYDVLNKVLEMYEYKLTVTENELFIEDLQDKYEPIKKMTLIEIIDYFIWCIEECIEAFEIDLYNELEGLKNLRIELV